MLIRTITAVIGLIILVPFLLFSHTFLFNFLISLLTVIAIYEMLNCIGFIKVYVVAIPTYFIAILIPLITRIVTKTSSFFIIMLILMFLYMFYLMAISLFSKEKIIINEVSLLFVMSFYIVGSFSSIILLRDLQNGVYMYLLVFISAWVTDTFAYFCGRLFGKHKLIPDVSPKKTVEGAIGGVVFCILAFALYGFIVGMIFDTSPNYLALMIAGCISSIISQLGDLIASLIKRHYDIKDYGKIFPGHGGILDRFDSIIATAPFLLVLCCTPTIFTLFS